MPFADPASLAKPDSIFILLFTVLLPVPQKVEWQSERFTALTVELTDILQRCFDPQPGLVTPAELFEALGPRIVRRLDLHGDDVPLCFQQEINLRCVAGTPEAAGQALGNHFIQGIVFVDRPFKADK